MPVLYNNQNFLPYIQKYWLFLLVRHSGMGSRFMAAVTFMNLE